MKPALTKEEWGEGRYEGLPGINCLPDSDGEDTLSARLMGDDRLYISPNSYDGYANLGAVDRHRVAALCLYKQEFGFTREHVELLDRFSEGVPGGGMFDMLMDGKDAELFASLRDLIKALLPPEEPDGQV